MWGLILYDFVIQFNKNLFNTYKDISISRECMNIGRFNKLSTHFQLFGMDEAKPPFHFHQQHP